MIVTKAHRQQPGIRPASARTPSIRAGSIGLLVGLLSTFAAVHAAQPPASTTSLLALGQVTLIDPGKRVPTAVSVANIDFKRGDGGAGKLVLQFDGEGANPDLRSLPGSVVIDVGNASLPTNLQRPLNVSDFATPVQRVDARQSGHGTQLVLSTQGNVETLAYQSGRDYVVEIVPRATAPTPDRAIGAATPATVEAASQSTAARAYSGKPVTFNFQDIPVRTVLQLIAEESGLNVVASDTVQGNVTLRLISVPWDQALDIVLQARGLDKRRSGNVVWIAPQAEIAKYEQDKEDARLAIEDRVEMVTEYVPISYGNAEDIAKLLTDESKSNSGGGGSSGSSRAGGRGFLSSRGSLSFDRRTNTLLVIDIPQRVAEVKRLVTTLDKPVDQVVIEARVVIASDSFARDLGAKFGVSTKRPIDDHVNVGGALGTGSGPSGLNYSNPVGAGAGVLGLTILGNTIDWNVELSALQTEGRGEVLSNPRIITSNQKEAVIRQGQEVGYLTVTGGQSNNVPTVQFKDVLLELKVTPTITADGRVYLNIALKKDEIEGFVPTGAGEVPQINKREITTAVLMDDGQTVSIGGVYEFRDRSSLSKVPFLGDLPFLGNLFKKRGRNTEKAELLIFVTPKVIRVAQRT